MKTIKFKECNAVYAEDQDEYLSLPVHRTANGTLTSCWKLNIAERIQILFTGKIFLKVMTFNKPLQPLKVSLKKMVT